MDARKQESGDLGENFTPPALSLPKGGGSIRGIGEKFAANPVTGTGSFTIPVATSPGRSGFGPQLNLSYDSGSGNGPFGLGWSLSMPAITRKTDKGLPQYQDAWESDVFLLAGAEDLVPLLTRDGANWTHPAPTRMVGPIPWKVEIYRPRIEANFARIERWTDTTNGETYWRSITRDNITTLYGRTPASRLADPNNPAHVFSWLACESYDDRGNAMLFEYLPEDSVGVDVSRIEEGQRTPLERSAKRYLKRVYYANRTPRMPDEDLSLRSDWMFEVVLDYGDHDPVTPTPVVTQPWPARQDAFSSYRSGFEVRTYRLCRRILMFHHFPDEAVGDKALVRSLDLAYDEGPVASFILSATQSGYTRTAPNAYYKESLPPVEFTYTKAVIDETIHFMDPASLENLPAGLVSTYRFTDLNGEGLSGILTEQGQAWYYKPNLGGAFGPPKRVSPRPSLANLEGGAQQLLDLAGDGSQDLVQFSGPVPGFYERTDDEGWSDFRPFASLPVLDWNDPELRFIDLTGDGHADVLLAGDQVFTWYPSLAEQGFGPAGLAPTPFDEKDGAALVFADGTQSIYLADMSGDGLVDLVRVRSGEVCYWPNLGYGRFGRKITMGSAPQVDPPDLFNQRRVRLADIDGSGTNDLIYLGQDGVRLYFNQSGNRFSAPYLLKEFPPVDSLSDINVLDLLGSGTACLVWSSPLLGETARPVRYIDLMGGQKPHLLVAQRNNLGAETLVSYAPSTKFYLADRLAGTPWITRLPFPVYVVERVETGDRVSKNRFVTRYAYHHGYFDGLEREFRGFGMVEQWDTEEFAVLNPGDNYPDATNLDAASHVPPVYTRSWHHTGAYLEGGRISCYFEDQYYEEDDPSLGPPVLNQAQLAAMRLDDSLLPTSSYLPDNTRLPYILLPDEARQACRSLKGSLLRQEVYALDGSQASDRPYHVSEYNYTIELLQPQASYCWAVFFTHKREVIDFYYDRALYPIAGDSLADPRVHHSFELAVDYYGSSLQTVSVGYGRRHPDPDPHLTSDDQTQQAHLRLSLTENSYTNPVESDDAWRAPLLCESSTYELVKATPNAALPLVTNLFCFDEMQAIIALVGDGAHDLLYEDSTALGAVLAEPYRRLVERLRLLYRRDDFTGPLLPGQLDPRGLPFERFRLALTPGLVAQAYGALVNDSMLAEAGYVHAQGDLNWWMPEGQMFYSPNELDTPVQELAYAGEHFFLPCRYTDPFNHTTHVRYDAYDLLVLETEDPLHNKVTAGERTSEGAITPGLDYRVLQPALLSDPNRNRSAAAFSALGLVVGNALMGKTGQSMGDSLAGFIVDLPPLVTQAHLANPLLNPELILQQATTRLVYDLFTYMNTRGDPQPQPMVTYTLTRETHVSDLPPLILPKFQHGFSYSDGFGREIQKKVEAEDGPLVEGGLPVSPRWVGSGWTVYNNKGKPVRQYEPFFSNSQAFEFGKTVGVSPVLLYDPLGRVVGTLHPDHTFEKTIFDPWKSATWDRNDTVLVVDPRSDPDLGDYFQRLPTADFLPTWYSSRAGGGLGPAEQSVALKTAAHAATPALAYFDSLARPFLHLADNGGQQFATRSEIDIQGQVLSVTDASGRQSLDYTLRPGPLLAPGYDLTGRRIYQSHIDAGERRVLLDVNAKPVYQWDTHQNRLHTIYDGLRRSTELRYLPLGDLTEQIVERTLYGETQGDALNHLGKIYQQFDSAGQLTQNAYDFKGNPLAATRQLASAYHTAPDWSGAVLLELDTYTRATVYDALNRPTLLSEPDGSQVILNFNRANLLESVQARGGVAGLPQGIVTNFDYNARGQRILVDYACGVQSTYTYDVLTFRLSNLLTLRGPDHLQELTYTYDPIGNLTLIRDAAQQSIYFNNAASAPDMDYTYDPVYRLAQASGREHISGTPQSTWDDAGRIGLVHPNDWSAMRPYTEQYLYDPLGNLLSLVHAALGGNWTRLYNYDESNLPPRTNHLTSTQVGADIDHYWYDADGNLSQLNLTQLGWDFKDRLESADVAGGGKVYYRYDASGQRIRKVIERANGTIQKERLYLGGYELYSEYNGTSALSLARSTLHVMDGPHRLALIETRTAGNDGLPTQVLRYQLSNHLGSASLELDHLGAIISYEEYYPFGSTSYQAGRNLTETSLKRYRFTGMERDSETGFSYHAARYYLPWLGRWASSDPLALIGVDPGNAPGSAASPYVYAKNRPTGLVDSSGLDDTTFTFDPVHVTPSLLDMRTDEQRMVDRYSGALGDFRLNAHPLDLFPWAHPFLPDTRSDTTTPSASPSTGSGTTAGATPAAGPSSTNVTFSPFLPHLQVDSGRLRFTVDVGFSSTSLSLSGTGPGNHDSLTLEGKYSGAFLLRGRGAEGGGSIGFDIPSRVGTLGVSQPLPDGGSLDFSLNTRGQVGLSLTGGGPFVPLVRPTPGSFGYSPQDLGDPFRAAEASGVSVLSAAPGLLSNLSPGNISSFISQHSGTTPGHPESDFTGIGRGVDAATSIGKIPQHPTHPDVRYGAGLVIDPTLQGRVGFGVWGGLQVVY